MISWTQTILISLVQGLTEFLPISSSAHLILVPTLFNWPEQGLAFDIVVHCGTLLAVLCSLRHICFRIVSAMLFNRPGEDRRLGWWLCLSPLPLVIATLALGSSTIDALRSPSMMLGSKRNVCAWPCVLGGMMGQAPLQQE
jgi:undecaprenyl-diphosphatase